MRKTKIICTLGPSTDKEGVLRDLIANGMNVARFNFSHGSHEEHLGRLEKLKALREERTARDFSCPHCHSRMYSYGAFSVLIKDFPDLPKRKKYIGFSGHRFRCTSANQRICSAE